MSSAPISQAAKEAGWRQDNQATLQTPHNVQTSRPTAGSWVMVGFTLKVTCYRKHWKLKACMSTRSSQTAWKKQRSSMGQPLFGDCVRYSLGYTPARGNAELPERHIFYFLSYSPNPQVVVNTQNPMRSVFRAVFLHSSLSQREVLILCYL